MRKSYWLIAGLVMVLSMCTSLTDGSSTTTTVSGTTTSSIPTQEPLGTNVNIIYLHHSTGGYVWGGGVADWFTAYNASNDVGYNIEERAYPDGSNYPWDNYPYDYWNIWVNHAGMSQYSLHDTLEILTTNYQVIVWKHCYPVSEIGEDSTPDITSSEKTLTNYLLQYEALKTKMHSFPNVRFVVWTGAVELATNLSPESAARMQTFVNWVKNDWDEPGDNIFVWDFYALETEGGIYLDPANAASDTDNHPSTAFSAEVAPLIGQRIVDVIEGRGDSGSLTGE